MCDCDVLGDPAFFGQDVEPTVWDCMFMVIGADGFAVELHRQSMTFAQADNLIRVVWPHLDVQVLVPEDFPPYGMEG